MANAYAQAPIVGTAQLRVYVAQAVVASMAAAKFELGLARCNVQLVVCDQDFFGCNLKKPRQGAHRLTAGVHEGLWFKKPHGVAVYLPSGHQTKVVAL